ncbi:MAG: hypothetical protein EBE86_012785 [Hormoscilla sp. GUM202]|nr:hypothetical protein [Hormoscilla sp. GUM202]
MGARKGNAKLETVVEKILEQQKYKIEIDSSLMSAASEFIARISGREKGKVNTYVKHKKPGLLNKYGFWAEDMGRG